MLSISAPLVARASVKNGGGVTVKNYCVRPGAHLTYANLTSANLIGANLYNAKMVGVNLFNAKLPGATMSNSYLTGATLTFANLTSVIWDNTTCPNGVVQSTPCA